MERILEVYMSKAQHFLNAVCCTLEMAVIFVIIPITNYLKWQNIVALIQVAVLLVGFKLSGRIHSSFEYEKKTENDEKNAPKEIFNRKEFRVMICASILAALAICYELKQYLINDGGFSYQLLIGTLAAAIGAMISIEDLFYGKSIRDVVKDAIGLNLKDEVSSSVLWGSLTAFFMVCIIGYYTPRHVEPGTELSHTRRILLILLLIVSVAFYIFAAIAMKKNSKKAI